MIVGALKKQSLHETISFDGCSHRFMGKTWAGERGLAEARTSQVFELSYTGVWVIIHWGVSNHTLGTVFPFPWAHGSAFLHTSSHLAEGGAKAVSKMILCKKFVCPQLPLWAMSHKTLWVRPGLASLLRSTFPILVLHSEYPGRGNHRIRHGSVATSLDKLYFQNDGTHFLVSPVSLSHL